MWKQFCCLFQSRCKATLLRCCIVPSASPFTQCIGHKKEKQAAASKLQLLTQCLECSQKRMGIEKLHQEKQKQTTILSKLQLYTFIQKIFALANDTGNVVKVKLLSSSNQFAFVRIPIGMAKHESKCFAISFSFECWQLGDERLYNTIRDALASGLPDNQCYNTWLVDILHRQSFYHFCDFECDIPSICGDEFSDEGGRSCEFWPSNLDVCKFELAFHHAC
jgi:hypothetical protein